MDATLGTENNPTDEDDGDETHQRATNEGGAGQHHLQQQQRKKMGQSSMENWTKSGTLNIDGRLKPLVRETMPSSLSSLGGQKKMIMVEESRKKKKLKTKKKNNNNNNNTTKFSAGGGGGFQQQQGQNETRARNTKQLSLVDAWKRRDNAGAPSPSPSPSLAPRKKPKTTVATSSSSSSLSKKSGTKSEFVRGLAMKARPLSSHAHPLSTSFSSSSSSSLRMTTTQTTTPSKAKRRTAKPPTSTFTTPDDDESDANISGIAFKSLVSTSATAATMAAANTTKTWPSSQLPMEATTAKPVGSNGWTGAVKAQPSSATAAMPAATAARMLTMAATTPSVLRNTLDESESGVDIACSTDLKSLRLKLDAATTVEGKKQVVETITTGNQFNLEYSPNALVELLVLGIKMDKINHPEQFNEEKWSPWLDGREDFHNRANEIHFDSSVRIKKGIEGELRKNNEHLSSDAVLADGAFLVENLHMMVLISRNGEPTIHKASEFKPIMNRNGFGKIIEATMLNVSPAPLHQQGLLKSGAKNGDCATKIAYLDILTSAATKAIFDQPGYENVMHVVFWVSDLLASIGPKHSKADNNGFIERGDVYNLHVRRKLGNGYAGINGDIVAREVIRTAQELGILCREKNTFNVANSAKARDLLLKNDSQLEAWSERTVAYGCALCCFRRAGAGSWRLTSLQLCMLMQQLGHGGIELALLSETNSDAFLKVKEALKEALKEATSDEITDERLEELASNHCERLLCYQGEFAADDGDDGPQTFHALLSCFGRKGGRKGGKAVHAKQGHFDRTKDSTGYNACAELAELGWSEDQLRNVVGETKKGKGFCLYKSFLASNQPPSQSRQSFTSTGYSAKFGQVVQGERRQQYGGGGGARMNTSGKVAPPVKTLAAVEKMKELAQKGEGPPVSRYAYVPKEEGTVEEKLKQLQKAIGMDDESQYIGLSYHAINRLKGHRKSGANLWNLVSTGYLACQKLRKDDWTADSLHRELQNRRAQEIFIKFCEYARVVLAPMNKSDHPYFEYVSRRSRKDKKYSTDEERQGTLRAIFMLQELVRKIEAGEVTPPTGENLE